MIIPGIISLLYLRSAPHKPIDSIAVLPFAAPEADSEAESLGDGITDALIRSLSQLPNLKVAPREASYRYQGVSTDAKSVGRELGVRAIVQGKIERLGDSLTIRAELIDAGDNSAIWSQQYQLKAAAVAALQETIAKDIHEHIRFH
jgi:adenylate cyclase